MFSGRLFESGDAVMTIEDRVGLTVFLIAAIIWSNLHIQLVFMICGKWCRAGCSANKKRKLYKTQWTATQRAFLIPFISCESSSIFKLYFFLYYLNVLFLPVPICVRSECSEILFIPLINAMIQGLIALKIPHRSK